MTRVIQLNSSYRRSLIVAAGLFLTALSGCGPTVSPEAVPVQETAAVPSPASPTTSAAISVQTGPRLAELVSANRGKVLVMNYWATWCPPCVHEMPEFIAFYNGMDRGKVAFISVSTDHPSTIDEAVKPFAEENQLPFPVVVFDGLPDDLASAVNVGDWTSAVPATFIYDASGTLKRSWNEEVTQAEVTAAVAAVLSGSS